jgi:uncharacterized protein
MILRNEVFMRCPTCQREIEWADSPWRPFCSERCQLIDLGRWATGEFRIPQASGNDPSEHEPSAESNPDEQG